MAVKKTIIHDCLFCRSLVFNEAHVEAFCDHKVTCVTLRANNMKVLSAICLLAHATYALSAIDESNEEVLLLASGARGFRRLE